MDHIERAVKDTVREELLSTFVTLLEIKGFGNPYRVAEFQEQMHQELNKASERTYEKLKGYLK